MFKTLILVCSLSIIGCSKNTEYEFTYDNFENHKNTGGFYVNKLNKLDNSNKEANYYNSKSFGYLVCSEPSPMGQIIQHPNIYKLDNATNKVVIKDSLFRSIEITCSSYLDISSNRTIVFDISKDQNILGFNKWRKIFPKLFEVYIGTRKELEGKIVYTPNPRIKIYDKDNDKHLDFELTTFSENLTDLEYKSNLEKVESLWAETQKIYVSNKTTDPQSMTRKKYDLAQKKRDDWLKNNIGKSRTFIYDKKGKLTEIEPEEM